MKLTLEDLSKRIETILKHAATAKITCLNNSLESKAASTVLDSLQNYYGQKLDIFTLKESIVTYETKVAPLKHEELKEKEKEYLSSFNKHIIGAAASMITYITGTAVVYEGVNHTLGIVTAFVLLAPTVYFWHNAQKLQEQYEIAKEQGNKERSYLETTRQKREQRQRDLNLYPEWMYTIVLNKEKVFFLKTIQIA